MTRAWLRPIDPAPTSAMRARSSSGTSRTAARPCRGRPRSARVHRQRHAPRRDVARRREFGARSTRGGRDSCRSRTRASGSRSAADAVRGESLDEARAGRRRSGGGPCTGATRAHGRQLLRQHEPGDPARRSVSRCGVAPARLRCSPYRGELRERERGLQVGHAVVVTSHLVLVALRACPGCAGRAARRRWRRRSW